MKLAVLYDFLETIGGGERVALTLADHFGADLITTNADPTLSSRTGFPGVNVINLGPLRSRPPLKQIDAAWKLTKYVENGKANDEVVKMDYRVVRKAGVQEITAGGKPFTKRKFTVDPEKKPIEVPNVETIAPAPAAKKEAAPRAEAKKPAAKKAAKPAAKKGKK